MTHASHPSRLERLLSNGYFPHELPPPFNCRDLAQHAQALTTAIESQKIQQFWTSPELYSTARYRHNRRTLSIVNPINQLRVCQLISDNWTDIRSKLNRSTISEFHPRVRREGPGRAVVGTDFDKVSRRTATILCTYGRYVKTDISRFYASIYTHSIGWALLGKTWVKAHFNQQSYKSSYANHLDKAIAAGQMGQTTGIPIGPDTSRIIAELVMTEIECALQTKVPDLRYRAIRYVDDIIIGLLDEEAAAAVLSDLSSALYEFQLELSSDKTKIFGVGSPHAPEWLHFVRTFKLSERAGTQRADLDSFFEQAAYLADINETANVPLYALRKAVNFVVDQVNSDHLVRWMMYIARRSPNCLSFVAEHLSAMYRSGDALPGREISNFIRTQIPIKAAVAHTDEVAWLLFWARETETSLKATLFDSVVLLRSSVCALLTLDLNQRGLIDGSIDVSFWHSFANSGGLESEMWLAAYEISLKGWWPTKNDKSYIECHKYFKKIIQREVHFYDENVKVRPNFQPLKLSKLGAVAPLIGGTGPYP